jgi:hypothetical protein
MEFMGGLPGDEVIDLYQFVTASMNECGDAALSAEGNALLDLLGPIGGSPDSFIINERHTAVAAFCHGMSIFFPSDSDRYLTEYGTSGYCGSDSTYHLFLIDYLFNAPPSTSAYASGTSGSNGWYTSTVTVTLTATDHSGDGVDFTEYSIDGGSWTVYTGPFAITADGEHPIIYRSQDNSGRLEDNKTLTVKIDRADPVISSEVDGYTVTLDFSDASSGVFSVMYRINGGAWTAYTGPFLAGMDGWIRNVEYYCTDVAGNPSDTGSVTIGTVDAFTPETTPTLSGVPGFENWYKSSVRLSLSVTDDGGSGIKTLRYSIDGGDWTTYTSYLTFGASGSHNVTFYAEDNYGNVEEQQWIVFKIDDDSPSVEANVDGPGTGAYHNGTVTISLSSYDGMSGVSVTFYRVDGGAWMAYFGSFQLTDEGSYVVEYYARDVAGNSADVQNITVAIDLTAPIATIAADGMNGDGWGNGSVSVSIVAEDGISNVTAIMYRVNSGAWTAYSSTISFDDDGTFIVECYAIDGAGNIGAIGSVTCRIDTTFPDGGLSMTGFVYYGNFVNNATMTITYSDEGSGLFAVYYRIDGGEWLVYGGAVELSEAGEHVVEHYAVDECDNACDVVSYELSLIEATEPGQVTGLTIEEGDGSLVLNWTAPSDSGLNITFNVYRLEDGGEMTLIATVEGTEYVDEDVNEDVEYDYYVTAVNQLGEGGPSTIKEGFIESEGPSSTLLIIVVLAAIAAVIVVAVILIIRRR